MRAKVYVTLKRGVLDPAGKAVESGLHQLGYEEVADVRLGKYIELTLDDGDAESTQERLAEMCDKLLANTVIEDFRIEIGD